MLLRLVFSAPVVVTVYGVTLNCVPTVPKDQTSMKCNCTNTNKNGVEWQNNNVPVTSCNGTIDNYCFPRSPNYTSNVSADEFYFNIYPYSYANCATYTCKDVTTGEEAHVTTSIAVFRGGVPSSTSEPGAGKDGIIEITTDCVFRETDIAVNWYIVNGGVEQSIPADEFLTTTTCSDASKTCDGDRAVTLNIGFIHKEKSNKCGQIRVAVFHLAYPSSKLEWTTTDIYCIGNGTTTSATSSTSISTNNINMPHAATSTQTSTTKSSTTQSPDKERLIIIISVSIGGVAVFLVIISVIGCKYIRKKRENNKTTHETFGNVIM